MKKFTHCLQHLITQQSNLGSLIAKALHSDQTKKLINNALSSKLKAFITDIHISDGIVTFLCSSAEKATLVRFDSIDLLPRLRQYPKLGHIKKIQVRVVPTFLQTQNNYIITKNNVNALEKPTESTDQKHYKISSSTVDRLTFLAEHLSNQTGNQQLKTSLQKLAKKISSSPILS